MKKLKRMLAVLLTAIMTLAIATTAFAAEAPKGNLKITANEKNTLNGQTIKVYKLFDLSVSGKNYAYTVNSQYKQAIANALGVVASDSTSETLYKKLAGLTENSTEIQKFADDFTEAVLNGNTGETATSEKLGNVTEHTFTGLDYGYYLVYQTGTKELQSSLVSVDKADKTIVLKGEAPSIEKTADKETVEIGEIVTYTIKGIIPDTTGYEQYIYKIHDTLTDGLDFVKDAKGTPIDTVSTYPVSVQIGVGNTTVQNAQLSGKNNRTMTLDLSQWIKDNQTRKGQEFTVTYYAKVNSAAVVETKNSASLEYGNDSNNTITTTPSEVKTPTYPMHIKKTDSHDTLLAGAKFRLYKQETDAEAANDQAIKVTGQNGSYTVAPDQTTEKNMDMISVETEVDTGYNLKLNGLAAGTYWLVETEAPAGYNKLTAPIKVTITKSKTQDVNGWTIATDKNNVTDKIIKVVNTTGTILPGTGGMGTVLFTVIGVALVLIVAASFVISRRKRAE